MQCKLNNMLRVIISSLMLLSCTSDNLKMRDFYHAKQNLRIIYYENKSNKFMKDNVSFYCGCKIIYEGRKIVGPDLNSCGYKVRTNSSRATRIEWEHIMPAHAFGNQQLCWRTGGRKNCRHDRLFNTMEGDMHNLVPSIGEINGDRNNFGFSDWNGKIGQYGKCPMVIDFKGRKAQPPKNVRGTIARAYLYMSSHYNLKLSKKENRLFTVWNNTYPPSTWECFRNKKIALIQGNENEFITQKCNY